MRLQRATIVIGLTAVALAGCGGIMPPTSIPTPLDDQPVLLPGSSDLLPPGVEGAIGWQGTSSFPSGFDAGAVHESPEALADAFADALLSGFAGAARAPRISRDSTVVEGGRAVIIVTEGGTGDDSVFGTQYAVVAEQTTDGWLLDQIFARALCSRGVTDELCL